MSLRASSAAVVALVLVAVAPEAQGKGGLPITTCEQTVTTGATVTRISTAPARAVSWLVPPGSRSTWAATRSRAMSLTTASTTRAASTRSRSKTASSATSKGASTCSAVTRSPSPGSSPRATTPQVSTWAEPPPRSRRYSPPGCSSTATGNRGGYGIYFNGNDASIQSSTVAGNAADGIFLFGAAPQVKGNHADGNGYMNSLSDSSGLGITATNYLTPRGWHKQRPRQRRPGRVQPRTALPNDC